MIPIFEQGPGKGIGHNVDTFRQRFSTICREHLETGRAKAFAFIFYDFTDGQIRQVLKDQGVFVQLDRLAGDKLSIFFLHSDSRRTVTAFNQEFLSHLGITETVRFPAVVFFKLREDQLTDIVVAELNSSDLIHGFKELYDTIERYVDDQLSSSGESRSVRWIKSSLKFITGEALQALFDNVFRTAGLF